MSHPAKNQQQILQKLGIDQLNAMQMEAQAAIHANPEVVLLSPTGTGKTLAFLLPIMASLSADLHEVQALVLAPSRELAIQIEQVAREMGSGLKTNAVYGGRSFNQDKIDLKHRPALLVGTPGRIADHLRRETFPVQHLNVLVLDEFDKSLEVGFETEMKSIVGALSQINKKVLTSATQGVAVPDFLRFRSPVTLDFLEEVTPEIALRSIVSPSKNKLDTLVKTLSQIGNRPGIVFCNFKDTIQWVSDHLTQHGVAHGCFYGGLEQQDRERALIQFRNGSHQLLIATDLAARGIDVPEIEFILHYHLPLKAEEFTHRNGRTARMKRSGVAYVLHAQNEPLPDYLPTLEPVTLHDAPLPKPTGWTTLFVSAGRRDKVSKGDIAGFFFKIGGLQRDQLGIIELKPECAFVAVATDAANQVVRSLNNQRLKKRKVRVNKL